MTGILSAAAPALRPAHAARPHRSRPGTSPTSAVAGALVEAGEMVRLLGRVVVAAVREPIGYWGDVRNQMIEILRMCFIPMFISTTAFGLCVPGLQGGGLFRLFGIPERLGSFFMMASVREFAPWINAMVVAGVIGTSMTADLGARRIREEIDAMEVLGLDPIRTLIVPRVIAVTVMTGLLDAAALIFGVIGGYIASVWMYGANSSAFLVSFWDNATTTDVWASLVKTTIFGLIIGVVCCYKGLHAAGGPAGVGRAVNQAVVIAFAGIYIVNYVFTTLLLGFNPNMQVYK
jgi:phospholipid/cholesterol/gamma-HCH transport system permease protein